MDSLGVMHGIPDGYLWQSPVVSKLRQQEMDWRIFLTIFGSVFIAELGDKTQLATMLFASDKEVSKYTVFLAASAALVVAAAFGVLAGVFVSEYISERYLHYVAALALSGSAFSLSTMHEYSNRLIAFVKTAPQLD